MTRLGSNGCLDTKLCFGVYLGWANVEISGSDRVCSRGFLGRAAVAVGSGLTSCGRLVRAFIVIARAFLYNLLFLLFDGLSGRVR